MFRCALSRISRVYIRSLVLLASTSSVIHFKPNRSIDDAHLSLNDFPLYTHTISWHFSAVLWLYTHGSNALSYSSVIYSCFILCRFVLV
ncbi:hypothetical protein XELAEV_18016928mg [Xenopus laevis]|uniref:Uncharacterized protein n=1 Tax=Xenopus laevis TaxID=8355 RepID=A0A974HS60_XENLA|nr:hypothetical protein XELAEV_18016928mg [Xenopus laevis]